MECADVLQAEGARHYRSPGCLCAKKASLLNSSVWVQPDSRGRMPVSTGNFLRELQERTTAQQPQSPLLRLPGELRNKIYELALSADEPLLFKRGSLYERSIFRDVTKCGTETIVSRNGSQDFNQLKFVCCQLYAEAACLELRAGGIHFRKVCTDALP